MYIGPVLNSTDYSWIKPSSYVTRDTDKSNIFGIETNPLKVLANATQVTYEPEETEFTPLMNYLYLMYPNAELNQFVRKVVGVKPTESNDQKMEKISKWVINNIKYVSDEENWGVDEFWPSPVMTLSKGAEDCDGFSLLIMSLALNAGVPGNQLRWYGGFVDAGNGAPSGGHAWVGYRRELDNEWVAVDGTYFPNPFITSLPPMKDDMKYKDDYFFMTVTEMTYTPGTNRIRDPEGYDSMGRLKNTLWIGQLVNELI